MRPAPATRDATVLADLALRRLDDVRDAAHRVAAAAGARKKTPPPELDELHTAMEALTAAVTRLAKANVDAHRRDADEGHGLDQLRGRRR